MGKLTVEAKIVIVESREGGVAIVFQSKRQSKFFTINLMGDEDLKPGDRVIVEVSLKPKRKRAKKSEVQK